MLSFSACKSKSSIVTSKKAANRKNNYAASTRTKTYSTKSAEPQKKLPQLLDFEKSETDFAVNPRYNSRLSEQIVNKAMGKMGSSYKSGGTTNEGYDCSGLIFATFSLFDIALPRSSVEQAKYGVKLKLKDARRGDLVFFKNSNKQINHVGMIVAIHSDEIQFIHAASRGGVIISSTAEAYYNQNLVQINRVID